jgi:hypothetical protein
MTAQVENEPDEEAQPPVEEEQPVEKSTFVSNFNKGWPVVLVVIVLVAAMILTIILADAFAPMANFRK